MIRMLFVNCSVPVLTFCLILFITEDNSVLGLPSLTHPDGTAAVVLGAGQVTATNKTEEPSDQQQLLPYRVAIRIPGQDGKRSQVCGASLIDPVNILTAAHCFEGVSQTRIKRASVYLNTSNLDPDEDGVVTRRIRSLVRHQDYDPETNVNDIAVITLDEPVAGIPGAKFSPRNVRYADKIATIVGWGITQPNGVKTWRFRKTSARIISNTECTRMVRYPMGKSDICSIPSKEREELTGSSCDGDGGSPIIVDGVQIGVVSQGPEDSVCGDPMSVDIDTRISFFLEWIASNAGQQQQ